MPKEKLAVQRSKNDTMWLAIDKLGVIYKIFFHKKNIDKYIKEQNSLKV